MTKAIPRLQRRPLETAARKGPVTYQVSASRMVCSHRTGPGSREDWGPDGMLKKEGKMCVLSEVSGFENEMLRVLLFGPGNN